jgi:hypothetical protein
VYSYVRDRRWPTVGSIIASRLPNPKSRIFLLSLEEARAYWSEGAQPGEIEDENDEEEEEEEEDRTGLNHAQEQRSEAGREALIKGSEDQEEIRGRRAHQSLFRRRRFEAPLITLPRQETPPRLPQ